VLNADSTDGLVVDFTPTAVYVTPIKGGDSFPAKYNGGLSDLSGAFYWFSIDSQNQRLTAGVGEARMETCSYQYQYDKDPTVRETNKAFLESLVTIVTEDSVRPIRILPDPVTGSVALVVRNTDDLTMDDIASGAFMPKANLSVMAQRLYDCISGRKFTLESPDFPDFAQAIEYSIATPGLWCSKRLLEKAGEFSKDQPNIKETYLRITLGENNGESPGIPYVLEIWPVGHFSPVHSHGQADAVIRVLHGAINVSLFPFLADGVKPFAAVTFNKDDVTWISPALNQVHQLRNLETNTETCITIQCYMYEGNDTSHYDYFDYIDAAGVAKQYEPDSDMDFLAFKALIKQEWASRPAAVSPRRFGCWP
jgi:hypothetical protein